MNIRFVSSNTGKIHEAEEILGRVGIHIIQVNGDKKIEEIQTEDVEKLVRDKVIKAFQRVGRPVFVEHTALYLAGLKDLPGGLTQIFWDRLQADSFASLVKGLNDNRAKVKTKIGYCDSQLIHYFDGEVSGRIPDTPAGPRGFQWDCVFVPDGSLKTFAELGDRKNVFSMRRQALDEFANFLASKRK